MDGGNTYQPLAVPIPGDDCLLQDAIDEWHQHQEALRAFTALPDCLMLQLSRFEHVNGDIRMLRLRVSLEARYIRVPAFVSNGPVVTRHNYVVNSVVVHLGARTSEGHCMNLMFYDRLQCWLSADDGNEAARGSSGDVSIGQTGSYAIEYRMIPGRHAWSSATVPFCRTWDT